MQTASKWPLSVYPKAHYVIIVCGQPAYLLGFQPCFHLNSDRIKYNFSRHSSYFIQDKYFIVVLFFILAMLGLHCSTQVFSSCSTWASRVLERRHDSIQVQQLWRTGSPVVAHGLSCPAACGTVVPWPEIEPASPTLEGIFSTTGPPGKSQD